MIEKTNINYHAVFDDTVDAIIITDGMSEKILDGNKSACALFDCKKEELIGNYLYNFLEDGTCAEFPKSPDQITMYGSVLSNKRIKTSSNKCIPVDMIINTFSDDTGNYVMTSLRDVSERVAYENKIVKINDELYKSNESKDKFFSIIAHDLKNPISGIIGLTEIMIKDKKEIDKEEIDEFIAMIKSLSENTYELLENLLNWARVQTKNIELEKQKLDLHLLTNKAIKILKTTADMKYVNLVNKIEPNFYITADENMINTIIRNFISNSIKFSHENSNVIITANDEEKYWNISVSDMGIGMEQNLIDNLFKVGVITSRTGTKREKGTGIGLLLSNEFAKLHNGKIIVKSEVNRGSEFIIQLPKT